MGTRKKVGIDAIVKLNMALISVVAFLLTMTQICRAEPVFRLETFADHDSCGCEANPTGNPVGGGEGYDDIYETGDFIVTNADELVEALGKAGSGGVVFVPDGTEINLSGRSSLSIPGGVTLAGTRGLNGSRGARIFNTDARFRMFSTGGDYVRVTGLRIEGQYGGTERKNMSGSFLLISHYNARVDNCEIYNFSGGGVVAVGRGASLAYIHHNYMHHIQRAGLGYPVCLSGCGSVYVIANKFDYGRHHIAATGAAGEAYEAAWNLIGENATSSHFDMHGGRDRGDGTDIAGDWMHIHHNTFLDASRRHVGIRGTPSAGAEIHNNWFARPEGESVSSTANTRVFNNVFGPDKTPQERATCFVDREEVECEIVQCGFCDWSLKQPADRRAEDMLGDPLPENAVQRLGTLRLRYDRIGGMAYFPDGRALVASGPTVDIWDFSAGKMTFSERVIPGVIRCLDVRQDGAVVLLGDGNGNVHEWDHEANEILRTFATGQNLVSVRYSPDSERVLTTGGSPPTLKEYELATGKELISIKGNMHRFTGGIYDAVGKTAFVGGPAGSEPVLAHYDPASGKKLNEWFKDYTTYSPPEVSADGTRLLAGTRHMAVEFKIDGYEELNRFRGHHGHAVPSIAYCKEPDQILTGSRDGSIRRWNRLENEVLLRWFAHSGHVTSMVVSPDGKRALSFGGRMVVESDLSTGRPTLDWARHGQSVEAVALMPDGKRAVSGSADATLRIWDVLSGKSLAEIEGAGPGAYAVAVSLYGDRIAVGCKDGMLREFSPDDGSLLREMEGHSGYVRSVVYVPGGLISAGGDGKIHVWPPSGKTAAYTLSGHRGGVLSVAVSGDGQKILSGGRDGTVRLWDAQTARLLSVFEGHRGWVEAVCFVDEDTGFSAGRDGRILKWNLQSGEIEMEMEHGNWIKAIAYCPDREVLYAGGEDNVITCWDTDTGKQTGMLRGHNSGVLDLAITPNGRYLVSASADTTLLVWETPAVP